MVDIYIKTDTSKNIEPIDNVSDSEWLKNTFLLSDSQFTSDASYKKWILLNRYRSSADYKVTCTAPGMNLSCNPRPQFTRYADIRSVGKLKGRDEVTVGGYDGNLRYGLGMGRYYSEAIDDNAQRIFMRFGVPTYQPLISWVRNSFDIKKAALNNRGFAASMALEMVDIITSVFAIAAAPVLALGMAIVGLISSDSRFYSMKPTMHLYWLSVENMINSLAARRTLLPNILPEYSFKVDNRIGQEKSITSGYIKQLHELLPDIIDSAGRISVFGLALKAQAAFNKVMHEASIDIVEKGENLSTEFTDYPINTDEYSVASDAPTQGHDTYFTNKGGDPSIFTKQIFKRAADLLTPKNATNDGDGQSGLMDISPLYTGADGKPMAMDIDPNNPDDTPSSRIQKNIDNNKGFYDKYKEYVLAEITEGAAFAVFTVESTGSVGESFSNTVGNNPLEGMFNSLSDKTSGAIQLAKQAAGVIPFLDNAVAMLGDTAAITVSNASFGLANPLLALAYGLHVSMPKVWESSSSQLPRASYKIRLMSPYGNAYSQLFNIYLPLSMILAAGLPRTTGSASHTSPYLCQVYDRGRVQISLGMMDSINITRGTSNLAFSRRGQTNAVDVDFTVANLDEVLSMDAFEGGIISSLGAGAKAILNPTSEGNAMQDYISVLAGLDVYNQVYAFPRMRLKLAEIMMKNNRILDPDPAYLASFTMGRFNIPKSIFGNNGALITQIR